MIDLSKFDDAANEIVEGSSRESLKDWLENYRKVEPVFYNFKPIGGKFQVELSEKIHFHSEDNDPNTPTNRYSIAA